jgi:hypothetical protein
MRGMLPATILCEVQASRSGASECAGIFQLAPGYDTLSASREGSKWRDVHATPIT